MMRNYSDFKLQAKTFFSRTISVEIPNEKQQQQNVLQNYAPRWKYDLENSLPTTMFITKSKEAKRLDRRNENVKERKWVLLFLGAKVTGYNCRDQSSED